MNTQIIVTAKFVIKADKLSESIALMKQLTGETNSKEAGCVTYYYLQNSENSLEFSSYEVWQNAEEEAKHWQTPHVQNALAHLPSLLETQPEIIKWKIL